MTPPDDLLLRLAQGLMHRGLAPHDLTAHLSCRMADLSSTLIDLQQGVIRWQTCHTHGWSTASQQVAQELRRQANVLASHATALGNVLETELQHHVTPPTLRTVYEDLRQLREEFTAVKVDLRAKTISIETEPITLEDVYLGAFTIMLDLKALRSGSRGNVYKIIALDPHPASSNEAVTHPHVRDQELCEGDAAAPLRSALSEGRLCDFFTVVRSVLQTYNSGSPYIALEHWDGLSCHDCGDTMDADDSHFCERCSNDFCESCMSYCRVCDESACRSCLETCGACDHSVCSDCLTACAICDEQRCKECLEECSACHKEVCADCRDACAECEKFTCERCLKDDLCPACREKAEKDHEETEFSTNAGIPPILALSGVSITIYESIRSRRRHRHAA